MSINKNDRRVKRTKKALCEGLSELMLEKSLRNITVQELSDKADIHRATFYVHYSDIYDLYEQMENTVVNDLGEIIVSDPTYTYEEVFSLLIEYIYEHSRIFRMFLVRRDSQNFYSRISEFLENKYQEVWKSETHKEIVSEEMRLLVKYHIQGCLAIISFWAEDNYGEPKEKILDTILKAAVHFDLLLY